jgi:hypothetical protein
MSPAGPTDLLALYLNSACSFRRRCCSYNLNGVHGCSLHRLIRPFCRLTRLARLEPSLVSPLQLFAPIIP